MMKKSVKVFAPATVANVACGFDVLGFAVDAPGDVVSVSITDAPGIVIKSIIGDGGRLPFEVSKNTAGVAIQAFLKHIESNQGVLVSIEKNLPLGSGMGSSAASSAAAVVAINELVGNPLSRTDLVPFAMEAERVACGAAHADNVAPAILGGFVLIRSYTPLDIIKINAPENLFCTVITPDIELRTEDARKVLKQEITMKDAIMQWGNLAALIAGLEQHDFSLIGRALQDVIVEPMRAMLIPGFDEVKNAALESGVLGCSISGSGPSIFALSVSAEIAVNAGGAMLSALQKVGLGGKVYVSEINTQGAKIID